MTTSARIVSPSGVRSLSQIETQRGAIATAELTAGVALIGAEDRAEQVAALAMLAELVPAIVLAPPELASDMVTNALSESEFAGQPLVATADLLAMPQVHRALTDASTPPCPIPAAGERTAYLVPTSGTTGRPKLISHTLHSLTRTVHRSPAPTETRWALTYEPVRFAGLQVVWQALLSGADLVVPSRTMNASDELALFVQEECTHFSATPSYWRRALMIPGVDRLAPRQITLGGEISDQAILDALAAQFPAARIAHVYASTETGTAFSISDGRAGIPSSYFDVGYRDVSLSISHRGTMIIERNGQPIDTGDLVERVDDRIVFRGRASGLINVGGSKIAPEQVEQAALSVEGITACRASAMPSTQLGSLVELEVVQASGVPADADRVRQIRRSLASLLPRFAVPSRVNFVDELPVNSSGKQARNRG